MAPQPREPDAASIVAVAKRLKNGRKTVIMLSGKSLRAAALELASRIARKTGARILSQQANGRIERGARRVPIDRVPFGVDQALDMLKGTEQVISISARAPVAFFAYPNEATEICQPAR